MSFNEQNTVEHFIIHQLTGLLVVQTPGAGVKLPNDWVLAMTGYQPDFTLLENMGVRLSTDGKYLPEYNTATMESNIEGLYLAGVVVGGMDTHLWFIENSREHAGKIAQHLSSLFQQSGYQFFYSKP